MNTDYWEFASDCFARQFGKACRHRGEDTLQAISKQLKINEFRLKLLETGVLHPDLNITILLANYLRLDISYFFLPDASPEHFELDNFHKEIRKVTVRNILRKINSTYGQKQVTGEKK